LPPEMLEMLHHTDQGVFTFILNNISQIERIFSLLCKANIKVIDMKLNETDLEDVFMSFVGKSTLGNRHE